MGKRESFLLILIAAFFMLLMYVSSFTINNARPVEQPAITTRVLNTFGREVTIILTGDVMFGRSVMAEESSDRGDPAYPFRKVGDVLRRADLVFINLENPIVENCPKHTGGFKFCASPELAEGLVYAGVDIVSLANNHSGDYGVRGIEDSKKFLSQAGIDWVGLGNFVVKEIGGVKYGFLGFDFTLKPLADADLRLVTDSDKKVDVLIVGVHWGEEYKDKANEKQKEIAKELVENGADVIVGHHPHWVQNYEEIDGVPVYYSLGNFIFDQMWSEETKKGLVIKLTFKDGEMLREEKLPVYISSPGQPEFVK